MPGFDLGINLNLGTQINTDPNTIDTPHIFAALFNNPDDPLRTYGGGPLTMVRATTATYLHPTTGLITSAAVDELRIEANGALIEGERENLQTYSESIDSGVGAWTDSGGTITTNAAVSPDGNTTASRVVIDGLAINQGIYSSGLSTATNTQVFSLWMKGELGGEEVQLGDASSRVNPTLTTEWARYENPAHVMASIHNVIYAKDNTAMTFYIWGAQLEEAAFASSYIPTTTIAVTRNQDVLTAPTSGNLPTLTNPGTIVVDFSVLDVVGETPSSGRAMLISTNDGGSSRFAFRAQNDTGASPGPAVGTGAVVLSVDGLDIASGQVVGISMSWGSHGVTLAQDGTLIGNDPGVANPADLATFGIGQEPNNEFPIYGHIKNLYIYDVALTDAQMVALTK